MTDADQTGRVMAPLVIDDDYDPDRQNHYDGRHQRVNDDSVMMRRQRDQFLD